MKIKQLKEQAAGILKGMRALLDKAEAESRNLSAEEQTTYNTMEKDLDAVRERSQRLESLAATEAALGQSAIEPVRPEPANSERAEDVKNREYRANFVKFLRGDLGMGEIRALQADKGEAGGAIIVPQQLSQEILKAVDDLVFIRRLATVQTLTSAASLGIPTLDADPADADWTTELATGDEDSTMDFGKRELKPSPIGKRIKVSNKLLRFSPNVEALVKDRLAYKFGITHEKAFMTGNGAGRPLGLFTASDNGISTGRDVSTGNTATSPTFDGLIEAKYTLKQNYWARAAWIFHRSCVKLLRKLKDGDGQYIWEESVVAGEPDKMLALPFYMSEYAPSTFSASQYVGVLGDYKFYHIADSLDMTIQRLVELYAESNQTGFIGRLESDGMPVLEEAFVRVKLAAS